MGETTAKLGMYLAGGGSEGDSTPDEEADVDKAVNDNLKILDAAAGFALVTSTTHPSNPYLGQPIIESDTGLAKYYDGSSFDSLFTNLTTGLVPSGSSTARDAYWGTPATGVARAALALQGARWFNTDKGYEQLYYAQAGDTGAGQLLAKTAGWYPSGSGLVPACALFPGTAPGSSFGVGTSVITTQANFFNVSTSEPVGVDFTAPIVNGTGSGVRIIVPFEGVWRIHADAKFNVSIVNLMVKKNSVTADDTGAIAMDSGSGVNSDNWRGFDKDVILAASDFLIFAWYSSTAGNIPGTALNYSMKLSWVRPIAA